MGAGLVIYDAEPIMITLVIQFKRRGSPLVIWQFWGAILGMSKKGQTL